MNRITGKLHVDGHTLGAIPAFSTLPSAERARIAPLFEGYRYAKNSQILSANEETRSVYFLLSGTVSATVIAYEHNEREVPYEDLEPGAMFGELAALDGAVRTASIVARSEASVVKLSAGNFRDLRARYPDLAEYALLHLTRMVRRLAHRVYELRTECARPRVLAEIRRRVESFAGPAGRAVLSPPPTDQQIADFAGTQREVVCRVIGALSREGIVKRSRSEFVVLSVERLEAFSPGRLGRH